MSAHPRRPPITTVLSLRRPPYPSTSPNPGQLKIRSQILRSKDPRSNSPICTFSVAARRVGCQHLFPTLSKFKSTPAVPLTMDVTGVVQVAFESPAANSGTDAVRLPCDAGSQQPASAAAKFSLLRLKLPLPYTPCTCGVWGSGVLGFWRTGRGRSGKRAAVDESQDEETRRALWKTMNAGSARIRTTMSFWDEHDPMASKFKEREKSRKGPRQKPKTRKSAQAGFSWSVITVTATETPPPFSPWKSSTDTSLADVVLLDCVSPGCLANTCGPSMTDSLLRGVPGRPVPRWSWSYKKRRRK
ncbi:hypothetical protein PAAG_08053 [Paracoccidioides lutzii Pb01]|uniref:Uncharacterized protein n=1 Tax=Paracoccidioides lutzii (strain ATCC MYA-826 / Pb01) TaxID=502779 RepID=C1HBB2_PARBA|nr:hypothetical protein PAAG_08053 [Paracoccidioides lutzii Pb01]EEH37635.2 hypothetical protein PAAG_08053 [Paracoccidioides lutzii Pb01]